LRPEDIQWETAVYAAGDVPIRELLETSDGIKQFLVSYWADNYLEFSGYKMARLFDGLVGYGEFLYDQDNNYSRKATNNFFVSDTTTPGKKRWLWADLPETDGGNICTTNDRSNVLEAVIQGGKLFITDEFREIVARRQGKAIDDALHAALDMVIPLIVHVTDTSEDIETDVGQKLTDHIGSMFKDLFHPSSAKPPNSIRGVDGVLDNDILDQLTKSFMGKCYTISSETADSREDVFPAYRRLLETFRSSSFTADSIVDKNVATQVRRMIKIYIHTAREKWLLEHHTSRLQLPLLQKIQQTYTSAFWRTAGTDDETWPELTPTTKKTVFLASLNNVAVQNNSSLSSLYEDPASTTYGVGYLNAARKNNCACNPFGCDLSANVLQGYYDRKVQSDVSEFISSWSVDNVHPRTHPRVVTSGPHRH
jgi:hypothetical protein